MFSGIVEEMATVVAIRHDQENIDFTLRCSFVDELKIDQSVSHNGVCLTVVSIQDGCYTVTAMKETLLRSNLGLLKEGDRVNVERSMPMNGRREMARKGYFTVDKGSVTVNGVSLTVINPTDNTFTVAIIPYTREHTNFADIVVGTEVNLEFDILGKYIARLNHFA